MKTEPINEMKLVFPSSSSNEGFARAAVAAFAAQLDPTVDEISDIRTAVSEAVTNCIVHAYRDTIGKIEILMRLYEGGKLVIQVKDKGCGMEDVEKAMEPLFTTGGEERAGRYNQGRHTDRSQNKSGWYSAFCVCEHNRSARLPESAHIPFPV